MQKLLGVVMCGGQSQRMGTDKGLIKQGDTTWAQLGYNKLKQLDIDVLVSVNSSQITTYSNLFNTGDLVVDATNISGPLNGILSVHTRYPDKDMLILGCDITEMGIPTLKDLIAAYLTNSGHDYYTYHNNEFYEPLCAIYTAKALTKLKQSDLTNYTLQKILRSGNTNSLQVTNPEAFTNHNTPI